VTISGRIEAGRRERRVLARVSRAAWRLEQAGRERARALAWARAGGISIRTLAAAAGLCPARVHQVVAGAWPGRAGRGALRAAGSGLAGPGDPDPAQDAGLGGRAASADRLSDEVRWLARVRAVPGRIAADGDGLAGPSGPGPGHRRGAARPAGRTPPATGGPGVPGLLHPAAAAASPAPQLERAWDAWRYQRGETAQRPGYAGNPFRPRRRPPRATAQTRAAQETGRCSGADGPVVTGTPARHGHPPRPRRGLRSGVRKGIAHRTLCQALPDVNVRSRLYD
jgi:hypothetical protein